MLVLIYYFFKGKAMEAVIKSDAQGSQNNRYKLEWITVSKSPITTFKVQYKANDDFVRKEVEVSATPVESDYWSGSHELTNLRPATVYTVRVASRNTFGYNDFGEEFQFATKGAGGYY